MCPTCHALDLAAEEVSGRGSVYSYALLHGPQNPAFTYPIVAALVDLEEGVRLVTNLVDVDPAAVTIGMEVEVAFEPTKDDGVVPVFRPRGAHP
ncbi:MAG: hypothetical protein JWM05_2724 [Acidimicrobiales bacterium]|nr:hypothetical protein [Acidimicrobiales bacterium]